MKRWRCRSRSRSGSLRMQRRSCLTRAWITAAPPPERWPEQSPLKVQTLYLSLQNTCTPLGCARPNSHNIHIVMREMRGDWPIYNCPFAGITNEGIACCCHGAQCTHAMRMHCALFDLKSTTTGLSRSDRSPAQPRQRTIAKIHRSIPAVQVRTRTQPPAWTPPTLTPPPPH